MEASPSKPATIHSPEKAPSSPSKTSRSQELEVLPKFKIEEVHDPAAVRRRHARQQIQLELDSEREIPIEKKENSPLSSQYNLVPDATPIQPLPSFSQSINILVRCKNLVNVDLLSQSDPMTVCSIRTSEHAEWLRVCQTESIQDNNNPTFQMVLVLPWNKSKAKKTRTYVRLQVFDIDFGVEQECLGEVELDLDAVVKALRNREKEWKKNSEQRMKRKQRMENRRKSIFVDKESDSDSESKASDEEEEQKAEATPVDTGHSNVWKILPAFDLALLGEGEIIISQDSPALTFHHFLTAGGNEKIQRLMDQMEEPSHIFLTILRTGEHHRTRFGHRAQRDPLEVASRQQHLMQPTMNWAIRTKGYIEKDGKMIMAERPVDPFLKSVRAASATPTKSILRVP